MTSSVGAEAFHRHRDLLEESIDPDSGLLDKLQSKRTLTAKEIRHIKDQRPFDRRNSILLEYIIDQKKFDPLVTVLRETKQTHLVNYLLSDAEYRQEFSDEWPLTESELSTLDANQEVLIDLLEPSELVRLLYSRNVINKRQMDVVNSRVACHEKNETLLEIIRRRSVRDWKLLIECLRDSNQDHIAEILLHGGAVLKVHANVDASADSVDDIENELSSAIAAILMEKSPDGVSRILQLAHFKCISAKKGGSIVLYFYCRTFSELRLLEESVKSGLLKNSIEKVFSELLSRGKKIKLLSVRVSYDQHQKTSKILELLHKERETYRTEEQQTGLTERRLNIIPLELLDAILQKSYLLCVMGEIQSHLLKDKDIFRLLASVDFCWFQRIKKRQFKKIVWRLQAALSSNFNQISTVYKNNRSYLEENIRLKGLVKRLKHADCLTDVQAAAVYRQNIVGVMKKHEKNLDLTSELLSIVQFFDETKHSAFIRCLRHTKQHHIARFAENGGVVIKAELRILNESRGLPLVDGIDETHLRDGDKEKWQQIDELTNKLKQHKLEIIEAGLDGYVAEIWLWCQTKDHIGRLQTLNDTQNLFKAAKVSEAQREKKIAEAKVNISCEQFKKYVVLVPIVANFTCRVGGDGDGWVNGITKLRNKICVLLNSYSFPALRRICIYEDTTPFHFYAEIKIEEIRRPLDVVSSDLENSLYVLDLSSWRNCVWKITEANSDGDGEPKQKYNVSRWLNMGGDYYGPGTLSVSGNGQLMMVSERKVIDPVCCLNIYESDAELRLSIRLPEDILEPRHAVETSTGNFIVLHWNICEFRKTVGEESDHRRKWKQMADGIWVVSEVSREGNTITRRFIPKCNTQELRDPQHLAVDSGDRLFVADSGNSRIILMEFNLRWNRILLPGSQEKDSNWNLKPKKLFYEKETKQLIVGGLRKVYVYTLNRK